MISRAANEDESSYLHERISGYDNITPKTYYNSLSSY